MEIVIFLPCSCLVSVDVGIKDHKGGKYFAITKTCKTRLGNDAVAVILD